MQTFIQPNSSCIIQFQFFFFLLCLHSFICFKELVFVWHAKLIIMLTSSLLIVGHNLNAFLDSHLDLSFHEQLKVTNSNTPSTFLWEALLITSNPISFSIRFVELKQLINHIKDHFNFGLFYFLFSSCCLFYFLFTINLIHVKLDCPIKIQ